MPYTELSRDRIGHFAIFNDENETACQSGSRFHEPRELIVGLVADRALRAMLENKNGIGFGSL